MTPYELRVLLADIGAYDDAESYAKGAAQALAKVGILCDSIEFAAAARELDRQIRLSLLLEAHALENARAAGTDAGKEATDGTQETNEGRVG